MEEAGEGLDVFTHTTAHCPSTAPLLHTAPPAKLVCETASVGQVAIGFLVRYLSMAVSARSYSEATHHCRALPRRYRHHHGEDRSMVTRILKSLQLEHRG